MDVTTNRLPEPSDTAPPRSVTSVSGSWITFTMLRELTARKTYAAFRTMEENVKNVQMENKSSQDDCDLKCKQYLISLFGESTAEYFLSPFFRSKDVPHWFSQLQDDMRDDMSAGALWDALTQRSTQISPELNTDLSMIARRVVDWKMLKEQDHLKHLSGVRHMFRTAQRNQAITALIFQHNPRFNSEMNNDK